MELFTYYLRYLTAVCEGSLTVEGLTAEGKDETEKAMYLQQKIAKIGLPEFVRRCAEAEGTEIPDSVFDEFDPAELVAALRASVGDGAFDVPHDNAAASENTPDGDGSSKAPYTDGLPTYHSERSEESVSTISGEDSLSQAPRNDKTEKQNAYEAFLDCLSLEDALLEYLIDVLKNDDGLGFFRLSQVTVRKELKLHDFLYWLGTKELYAEEAERACATILDACMDRLAREGQMELIAALLSGDRRTFELFRVDAPELRQLPDATYEWFEEYYLNRYYPYRTILKLRGVQFPQFDFDRASP